MNILRLRSSHPQIFTSRISHLACSHLRHICALSHLRSSHLRFSYFTSSYPLIIIFAPQIFISYIFMSADLRISDFHIFYHRMCITSAHLHISDPNTSEDRHILYPRICITSAIFISQIFISNLCIFTFIFRSSYFETTSCLHIFGSSSRSHTVLFSRMRSEGSRFIWGSGGEAVFAESCVYVRNRPQPFATVRNRLR